MKHIEGAEAIYRHKSDDSKPRLARVGKAYDYTTKAEKILVRELIAGEKRVYALDRATLTSSYDEISSRTWDNLN